MSDDKLKTNERGFYEYREVESSHGEKIQVTESSAANGPHCWLSIEGDTWVDPSKKDESYSAGVSGLELFKGVKACAHLNPEQTKDVIARLQTWLDQIPERWP